MLASVVCPGCGTLSVFDVEVELQVSDSLQLSNLSIGRPMTFEEFWNNYRHFALNLAEFPIEKKKLIERIKRFFRCSTSLAYDILDRLKLDLGLYEKDGMIYSTDEYL